MTKVYILALALATSLTPAAASAFEKPQRPDQIASEHSENTQQRQRGGENRGGRFRGQDNGGDVRGQRGNVVQYQQRNREERADRRNDPYTNRNGDLNGRVDRNRDGNVDRRYDRNNNRVVDQRYDRDGQINERRGDDRRYGRNDSYSRNGGYRHSNNSGQGRHDGWDQRWRNDNRYNWRDYRNRYGNHYRIGRYYSPYRGDGYSRFNIGFSIGSPFYSSRYWINDPYHYRLPPAYGSYRWVRYYDDVLLIDTRTGYVADVLHNFFW